MRIQPRTPRHAAALALAALTATALTTPAFAAPPDYGLDFVTVGDPGNRAANEAEAPNFYDPLFGWDAIVSEPGAVGYAFRIIRNEVTVTHWGEFLEAYAPHYQGSHFNLNGSYYGINANNEFSHLPGTENHPADHINWHTAARYCNWLHNGKINEAWAFETGAYDTSHFQPDADGRYTDTNVRLPGAKFWIPSLDEYIKAAYYDPNRYEQGQPGYWPYPHMSETPVTPEESDVWFRSDENTPANRLFNAPVGEYPDVHSPWGLLGVSGGAQEWLEDPISINGQSNRMRNTSLYAIGDLGAYLLDRVDDWDFRPSSDFGTVGLRIATIVPSPGALGVFLIVPLLRVRPRRR